MTPSSVACVVAISLPISASRGVELDGLADQRLQRLAVDLLALVDVERAPGVAAEAGVEEIRGVLQRGALGEGQLHLVLVALAGADDPVVRPDRVAPFPLLDDLGVGLLDQAADAGEGLAAPVAELRDPLVDQLGGTGVVHRTSLSLRSSTERRRLGTESE